MDGYKTGTENDPEEVEEEEILEGNRKQPETNPIRGSSGWEKKAQRGHAQKGRGTWPGMQRD